MQRPWEHLQFNLLQIPRTKTEEITMFVSFKKIHSVQISLADIPSLFFQAENHGSTLSTSFHFSVPAKFKADDTWTHKEKNQKWVEKHFQLTQRGTASFTCYSLPPHVLPYFCRLSKSLHSSAIYLSPVFSVCTANLQCLWDCSKFNKILFSEGYKIPRTPVKIWSQRGSQFS